MASTWQFLHAIAKKYLEPQICQYFHANKI